MGRPWCEISEDVRLWRLLFTVEEAKYFDSIAANPIGHNETRSIDHQAISISLQVVRAEFGKLSQQPYSSFD
jgi:hypothetical protein